MKEIKGNLWDHYKGADGPLICITTNGFVKKNGEAVMGRGCAREAMDRFDGLALRFGNLLKDFGNTFIYIGNGSLFSFPVKHNWWEEADIDLIRRSAQQLMEFLNRQNEFNTRSHFSFQFKEVILPKPGCGNGKLDWESQVKPILEEILGGRVSIISPMGEK